MKSDIYATLLRLLNQRINIDKNMFTLDVNKGVWLVYWKFCPNLDKGKPWWLDMFSFGKSDTSNFGHKFKI